jgi:serine/threonine protein kinase
MDPKGDLSDLRIIDFGVAIEEDPDIIKESKMKGTLIYEAPECLIDTRKAKYNYDSKVDTWGAGIIMYELFMGRHPFYRKGMKDEGIRENINATKHRGEARRFTQGL